MSNNTVTTNSNDIFIKASEVAAVMNVSRAYAYRIVKQLNEELAAKGMLTIDGRTTRRYFFEKLQGAVSA